MIDRSASATVIRPYRPERDAEALWRLKTAFEQELAGLSGTEASNKRYREKLDDRYRERYLAWVDRCVEGEPCVQLAVSGDRAIGYAFILPERLAMIWDGAVLNELFVEPDHRGTGVADELLAGAMAVAREQSLPMDRFVLDVGPSNDRARAFYRRHGFQEWGELVARPLSPGITSD